MDSKERYTTEMIRWIESERERITEMYLCCQELNHEKEFHERAIEFLQKREIIAEKRLSESRDNLAKVEAEFEEYIASKSTKEEV